jgi:acyl-[acyl carrier protein]--UDP-N-acetylglucosamine O-acyltransferase
VSIHETAIIGERPESRDFPESAIPWPPHIDTTARIEALCTVDSGIANQTHIGARTWLMKQCHVGHDAHIGADCEFAPGCRVGGHVTIGNRVRVGMGAIFKPFIRVGDGARIGMGAVVIRDVPPGEVWAGNPARCLKSAAERQRDQELDMAAELEWERIADSVGRPHPAA